MPVLYYWSGQGETLPCLLSLFSVKGFLAVVLSESDKHCSLRAAHKFITHFQSGFDDLSTIQPSIRRLALLSEHSEHGKYK